jgi:hypothetical protein
MWSAKAGDIGARLTSPQASKLLNNFLMVYLVVGYRLLRRPPVKAQLLTPRWC